MASTRPPFDASHRSESTSSRRSISSHADSASRALASAASSSVSTPYGGLPSSASSSSSSSSTSRTSQARRSISSTGRNSFSRLSPSTSSLVNDKATRPRTRRNGSAGSGSLVLAGLDSATDSHQTNNSEASASDPRTKREALSASGASQTLRHKRHHSTETLRLDLDGLDLGGNQSLANPFDAAATSAADQRHVRSSSNNVAIAKPFASSRPGFIDPFSSSKPVDPNLHQLCASCTTDPQSHPALHGLEDSFSLHLRAECSDYRQIMPAQIVLNAAANMELRMRNASTDSPDQSRSRGYSISHGQVLGGFASLGLQTEPDVGPAAPPARLEPVRTDTKHSTDSSEPPATPIEWRHSFASPSTSSYDSTPTWAHLTSRPCDPLEPLDVLSIQEMGFHSLDVGSLNDWEGCKLSAEILCPLNGHQRIEWSVAQTTRRTKKWVVVPNATITCGNPETLSSAVQAERTVVVSERSIWLDEAAHSAAQANASLNPHGSAPKLANRNRSSRPFSGKSGFELRLLRPTTGRICPPVYLANASTHRSLHQYRTDIGLRSKLSQGSLVADRLSPRVHQPVYPVLRRSRSRPYLRHQHVPLRRSRSKPYLKPEQHAANQAVASSVVAEDFAPSLAGDPDLRMHPGESWPSARSRSPRPRSSFDSMSSSGDDSDTSSNAEIFSAPKTHESTSGSASSASYDHSHKHDAVSDLPSSYANGPMPPRSAPVPVAANGNRHGSIQHSPSDKSAATSWQHSSLSDSHFSQRDDNDSWQGASQTTAASASSLNASSKQSRSRKGLQRALQKKDKVLNSWFKRRPDASAASADGQATQGERSNGVSPSPSALPSPTSAHRSLNGGAPARTPRESSEGSGGSATSKGPTPLTETALESFQRAMFRPASPESTIMGSRRGSEALTQKAVEPSNAPANRSARDHVATNGAAPSTDAATDKRTGVHTTLSALYGWDREQAASKLLLPSSRAIGSGPSSVASTQGSAYLDLDEQNALLGIDAVPADALTMLIPLPLIGRSRARDAVRYMRVNFVPFGSLSDSLDTQRNTISSGFSGVGPPSSESEAGLSHSTSNSSGNLASHREAAGSGSGTAKSSEQSNWKRKLGLSGRSGAGANGQNGTSVVASQVGGAMATSASKGQLASSAAATEAPSSPLLGAGGPQAFRITAIVHDAPWTAPPTSALSQLDPRLPEPGTFPVVLGYCNGSKTLEMVPEGWGALSLAGVPVPTKPDGSALEGVHPLHGVSDLIISACTAVMDV